MILTKELVDDFLAGLRVTLERGIGKRADMVSNFKRGIREMPYSSNSTYSEYEHNGREEIEIFITIDPPFMDDVSSPTRPTPCGCYWTPGPNSLMVGCAYHRDRK